tara:strand:+ start:90 stop:191 length:102 start_codon:yes stop_codon:yes gene_type:complete
MIEVVDAGTVYNAAVAAGAFTFTTLNVFAMIVP